MTTTNNNLVPVAVTKALDIAIKIGGIGVMTFIALTILTVLVAILGFAVWAIGILLTALTGAVAIIMIGGSTVVAYRMVVVAMDWYKARKAA